MKPKRPYKNIQELRASKVSPFAWNKKADTGFWPCPECGGNGKVRHEKDRDVIEGYKLAPWYTCNFCDGDGTASREYWRVIYRRAIQKWQAECAEYERAKELVKRAKAKLTPGEIKALGI